MTSQPGKQTVTIHILPFISRRKETWETFFLKNHTQINVVKLFPDNFPLLSLDQQSKVLYTLFLLYIQVEGYRNILKLRCRPLGFTSYVAFLKNKKRFGPILLASFSAWFLKKKYLSHYILLTGQISLSDCLYYLRCWAIRFPVSDVIHFDIILSFLIKPLSHITRKVRRKTEIS